MSRMKLKDIALEKNERVDNPSQSPYNLFVGLEHYDSGEATIRRYGSTERLESTMKVFHAGDVLIARRNVYLKRAATVNFDGLTSGDSIVLHIENGVYRRIIPFVLNTDDFWNYANQHADGSMSKRLSPKLLMEYEFSLPDSDIEKASDILWAMERVKKAYRELIARTEDLVKSQFIEMFGELDTNEEGWLKEPLKKHAEVIVGYPFPSTGYTEEGIRIVGGYNLMQGYINWDDSKHWPAPTGYEQYLLKEGDIVMAMDRPWTGSGFKMAFIDGDKLPAILIQRTACIRAKDLANEFLYAMLNSSWFAEHCDVKGSLVPHISNKDINSFSVFVPPIELQREYATFYQQSAKSKFAAQQTLKELTVTQKALMKKIFK